MKLPIGEPLAKNNVFGDLLTTLIRDNPVPPQLYLTKTISLPLTDEGEEIYHICLERADGSVNSDNKTKQKEDNTGGGGGGDLDNSNNDYSNSDSKYNTPPPLAPIKRRQVFKL